MSGQRRWQVRGHPTERELAAVVAAVDALRRTATRPAPAPTWHDGWGAPAALLRHPLPPPHDPGEDDPW